MVLVLVPGELEYSVGVHALKMVELLQLGKLEKGALTSDSKYNSRNGRWFSQKASGASNANSKEGDKAQDLDKDLWIQRDSLVQSKCKRGKTESIEYYRVLGFFTKYYNKWFVSIEEKFAWEGDPSKMKNVRVLARMMKKSGSTFEEVSLEADGDWSPTQVYCIKNFKDIIKVENVLVDMM